MTLVCLQICRKNIAVSILACINHEVNKKKLYIYIYIYICKLGRPTTLIVEPTQILG